jgi:hypothetical protein
MMPEITIKISFAPAPSGVIEPTVKILDISPPELPEGAPVVEVPPPPEVQEESLSSFTYEVPPPPTAMPVEYEVPSVPGSEGAENVFSEIIEPPPTPTKGEAAKKTVDAEKKGVEKTSKAA